MLRQAFLEATDSRSAPSNRNQPQRELYKLSEVDGVDFSVFGAREVRDVLKSRAYCLKAGFPWDHPIIATFNEIRDEYIKRVGLPTYLSQMLGPLAVVPVEDCKLYQSDQQEMLVHLNGNGKQPLQRFIRKQLGFRKLPFKVEVPKDRDGKTVEVRYL
ncbi:MAG: hypothetical protein ACE5H9_03155 [Anaerolineae bacterium]